MFVCLSRSDKIYEPAHVILLLIALASYEGSSEPVHPHRLVRAFAASMHTAYALKRHQSETTCADPERRVSKLTLTTLFFFVILVNEGREALITTKRGPTSACQQNAIKAFRWQADDGTSLSLNAG